MAVERRRDDPSIEESESVVMFGARRECGNRDLPVPVTSEVEAEGSILARLLSIDFRGVSPSTMNLASTFLMTTTRIRLSIDLPAILHPSNWRAGCARGQSLAFPNVACGTFRPD